MSETTQGKKYIIALDQGTTSSRTVLIDHDGTCVDEVRREFGQILLAATRTLEAPAIEAHHGETEAFAFIADISMGTMGGALKRKEKLSARLGDILSLMYLATATLKRYESEGRHSADAPLMHWAIWDCMFRIQQAFEGVIANFPNKLFAFVLRRVVVFPLGRPYVVPSDKLGHKVAALLLEPSPTRDRLTADVHLPTDIEDPVGALEAALAATLAAEPVEARLKDARRQGRFDPKNLASGDVDEIWRVALHAGVIDEREFALVERRNALRNKVIRVDDFPYDLDLKAAVQAMPERSPAQQVSA